MNAIISHTLVFLWGAFLGYVASMTRTWFVFVGVARHRHGVCGHRCHWCREVSS